MRAPAKKPASYQDILALPEKILGQIVAGELYATPRPAFAHTQVTSALGGTLWGPFGRGTGGPGGWLILDEPELHLGNDVLVPDLAGWRRTRMPQLPAADAPFLCLAPDWICEVLSPSTTGLDRIRKMPVYARERVEHAWLIDPVARTLEVFHLEDGEWVLKLGYSGNEKAHAAPFEALEIDLATLWLPEPTPD